MICITIVYTVVDYNMNYIVVTCFSYGYTIGQSYSDNKNIQLHGRV